MKKKIWLIMVSLLSINLLGFYKEANSQILFYENFESKESLSHLDTKVPGREDRYVWEIVNGELRTPENNIERSIGFAIGDESWGGNCEIEFRVKRLKLNPKDQHFGIDFIGERGLLKIYCRGESIIYLETFDKKEIRHEKLGNLSHPLEVGEDAKWAIFRIIWQGNKVEVYVDRMPIGVIENLLFNKGKISFYAYNLVLSFDDIKVISLGQETKEVKQIEGKIVNIVPNSSFEYCTEPGLADYWGCPHWGLIDPYWVVNYEKWRENFGIDESISFEGKRSMRICNPFDKVNNSGLCLRSTCLNSTPNKQYILSAYMKGSPSGMKVSFSGKEIVLTEEWQRYSTSFINQGNIYQDMINIYPLCKGTFWVDAVQLEEGEEHTPYSYSLIDHLLYFHGGKNEGERIKVPELTPEKLEFDVILDGDLNELCWQKAKKLDLVLLNNNVPTEPTSAYLFYNEKGIYIGVKCFDKNSGKNKCEWVEKDGNVWNDPSIEIFIQPRITTPNYYHLAFNQIGVQYDAVNADSSWNGFWKVATKTYENFWSAEVFLPFGNFGIDKTTDNCWGINICRENHNKEEYSCWSPTYGGFHTPERFGRVYFDNDTLSNYYIFCENVEFQLLSLKESSLFLKIINTSKKDRRLLLSVSLKNKKGEESYFEEKIYLPTDKEKEVSIGKIKNSDEKYMVNLSLLSEDKNTLFYSTSKYISVPLPLDIKSQYNFYTKEKDVLLKTNFNLNKEILGKSQLVIEIKNSKGQNFLEKRFNKLSPEMNLNLPIEPLPCGDYIVLSKLLNKQGNIVASAEEKFMKLLPKPYEVKIDKISRIVIVNGKPFIPFGFCWEGEITPEVLNYLSQNGFNFISFFLNMNQPWDKYLSSILDNAYKSGIKVTVCLSGREKEKVREIIEKFKEHPAILAWDIFDEVFTGKWGKENYQIVVDTCKEMKEIDPYHPVLINENEYGISYLKSKGFDFPGDIVSIDYYPYPPDPNILATIDYVKIMEEMGRKDGKPLWIYPFGGGYAFWASRELTACEQECHTYASIVNGVSGIRYFANHPRSKSHWEKIKEMAHEIQMLTPIIASQEKVFNVNCSSSSIQILTKKYNNKLYLITLNSSKVPVTAKFDITNANLKKNFVNVLFENRVIDIKNNLFKDNFEGYQRHIYEVSDVE